MFEVQELHFQFIQFSSTAVRKKVTPLWCISKHMTSNNNLLQPLMFFKWEWISLKVAMVETSWENGLLTNWQLDIYCTIYIMPNGDVRWGHLVNLKLQEILKKRLTRDQNDSVKETIHRQRFLLKHHQLLLL